MSTSTTPSLRMPAGRYAGERITRVPQGYLRWMVRTQHELAEAALAELERRGAQIPALEITGHAIDRASTRCLKRWKQSRKPDEGLHAWLARITTEAIQKHGRTRGVIHHEGVKLVLAEDGAYPVLTTVMRGRK